MVNLTQRGTEETCREHYAPEGAQCNGGEELDGFFHGKWFASFTKGGFTKGGFTKGGSLRSREP